MDVVKEETTLAGEERREKEDAEDWLGDGGG